MEIRLIDAPVTRKDLLAWAAEGFGDMIKGVVDVSLGVLALGGQLHADAESKLLEQGSLQENLWGINLYPARRDDAWLEFDSMINIRPAAGNRGRGVEDGALRARIRTIVARLAPGS